MKTSHSDNKSMSKFSQRALKQDTIEQYQEMEKRSGISNLYIELAIEEYYNKKIKEEEDSLLKRFLEAKIPLYNILISTAIVLYLLLGQ